MKRLLLSTFLGLVSFNFAFSQAPGLVYAENFGPSAKFIDVTPGGIVYITGTFTDNEDYGSTTLHSNGDEDVFVVKLDPAGAIVWAVSFGGVEKDEVYGIDVDEDGFIHIAGAYNDEVDFDPGSGDAVHAAAGDATDGYVLTLDSDGSFENIYVVGGPERDVVTGVSADDNLNLYITGYFAGNADLDPTDGEQYILAGGVGTDAFFVRINANSSLGWIKTVGNGDSATGMGVAVDFTGTPIFSGHYYSALDINPDAGNETLTPVGSNNDIFILKLGSATGAFVWGKSIGGNGDFNQAASIHADLQNNIYLTGTFKGEGDFDPGTGVKTLTANSTSQDIFVTKFHPSGGLLWAHGIGGPADDWGTGVAFDGSNVFVSGAFNNTVDFDPGSGVENKTAIDDADLFVMSFDPLGEFNWVAAIGGPSYEEATDIGVDDDNNVYATGVYYTQPLDFDLTSCNATLDPETAPSFAIKFGSSPSSCITITSQPQSSDVCQGSVVTFTVVATGTNLSYQWFREDNEGDFTDDVEDDAVFSGSNTATLTINTATLPLGFHDRYMVTINGDPFQAINSTVVGLFVADPLDVSAASRCGPGSVKLRVTDLFLPGAQFRWYTAASGGTAIGGATGPEYTTPVLTTTTTYYVSRVLPSCETPRAAVTATIGNCDPIPEFVWAKSTAPSGRVADMYIDKATGTVYVSGVFAATYDFDPGPGETTLDPDGAYDTFIAKYTTAGDFIWARQVNGPNEDDNHSIAVDKDGNVIVSGHFINSIDLDPGTGTDIRPSVGSWDIYVVKLDGNGNYVWGKTVGSSPTNGDLSYAVTTDAAGNVYVGGRFNGTIDADPGPGSVPVTTAGNTDGLILKLAPNGNYVTHFVLRGPEYEDITDLEIDASGNIYATGFYYRDTDFDPGTGTVIQPGSSDRNAFALKLNSAGVYQWHKAFWEEDTYQDGGSIQVDSDGNVVVGGVFEGTIDFDQSTTGTDIHVAADQDAFAVKMDANGNFIWARTLPTYHISLANMSIDGTDVYLYGGFFGTVDVDPGPASFPVTTKGASDAYITKLDKTGTFRWAVQFGGLGTDNLWAVGVDNNKNIYAGGWLNQPGDYDPGPNEYILTPLTSNLSGSMVKLGAPSSAMSITTQPTTTSACEGGTATFTVAATGAANIQYHWQKFDGSVFTDITNGGAYSGTTTATLSINTTGNVGAGKYRARVSGDGVTDIFSQEVDLTIVTTLTPPVTTGTTRCGPGAIIVNASGTTTGNYRWYAAATGGASLADTDSYTAGVSATTTYYVSIVSGSCESTRTPVTATVTAIPAAPTTSNITRCTNATTVLTASGGTAGSYRWYNVATGGTPVSTSDSFTTPALTANTTYYVSTSAGGCESLRTALVITVTNCSNNQPPVITTTTTSAGLQGTATINLTPLITDPDNNLDPATLKIVVQPKSGATATIDQNGQLHVDYSSTSFAGEDELTVEICDIAGSCVQQTIRIIVSGETMVYNAVSPNGDGKNDVFHIAFIDVIPGTKNNKVSIYNRWGALVFEIENYNNTSNVFSGVNKNGNELPSGTYFYRIEFTSGRKSETGYLSLKR